SGRDRLEGDDRAIDLALDEGRESKRPSAPRWQVANLEDGALGEVAVVDVPHDRIAESLDDPGAADRVEAREQRDLDDDGGEEEGSSVRHGHLHVERASADIRRERPRTQRGRAEVERELERRAALDTGRPWGSRDLAKLRIVVDRRACAEDRAFLHDFILILDDDRDPLLARSSRTELAEVPRDDAPACVQLAATRRAEERRARGERELESRGGSGTRDRDVPPGQRVRERLSSADGLAIGDERELERRLRPSDDVAPDDDVLTRCSG